MPYPPVAPPELTQGPFLASAAIARGVIRKGRLQSRCWRRLLRDVYVWDELPDTAQLRAAAAALLLPPGGAVSGPSAVWLHTGSSLDARLPLEVTFPRTRHPLARPELRVRQALLPDDDLCTVGGVPVTTPLRTAFDLARRPALVPAVVAVDALAHRDLVTPAQVAAYAPGHRGWRGVRRVPAVLDLVEPAAESPMETRLRLVIVLAGLPRPVVQYAVHDPWGDFAGRPDLAYPQRRLGIEYDGRHHRDETQYLDDLRRQNRLREQGWTLLRYVDRDVFRRAGMIVAQVERALAVSA